MRRSFEVDPEKIMPIGFFVDRRDLQALGPVSRPMCISSARSIPARRSISWAATGSVAIVFSRLIYGTRISLSIGLVGVVISLVLGVFLGGISGYYGGAIDTVIQRVVEIVSAMPTIPLWMGLGGGDPALLAAGVGLLHGYWRSSRCSAGHRSRARCADASSRCRDEDFVTAARLDGSSEMRLIFRHMLPSITSRTCSRW